MVATLPFASCSGEEQSGCIVAGPQKPSVMGKGGFGGVSLALGPVSGLHLRDDLDSDGRCHKPCPLWTPALFGGEEPPAPLHTTYAPGMPNRGFLVSRQQTSQAWLGSSCLGD